MGRHPRPTTTALGLWALFAFLFGCTNHPSGSTKAQTSSAVMDSKQDQLKRKIGLDNLPPGSAARGVRMAWSSDFVAAALQAAGLAGFSLVTENAVPQAPGETWRKWIWATSTSPVARLIVQAFVSSAGPAIARAALVRLTTVNMRPDVPYDRGPADLGDVSAVSTVSPSPTHIVWVFHNVCMSVLTEKDPGADVTAIARALQSALAQHVADALDAAVPKVEKVELSAPEVRVDEPLTVHVRMQGADPQRRFLVALHDRPADVRVRRASLDLEVTADNPGAKALTILIADASTLLSTSAQAKMVVRR
jgi:hypothetical protein